MTLKLAFIGLGQISEAHLNGVRKYNEGTRGSKLEVSAVVDTFPGRAQQWVAKNFAGMQQPVVLNDYRELLQGPNRPDMVSILLPHHLHLEVARPFLEAGIAIQMQKPIGLAMADSREMIELAEKHRTPMVVSEPSVLGRRTRMMLQWLRSGRQIGTPTLMIDQAVIDLKGGFFMTPWRHLKGMAGAGWFIDHGVHRTHWMLEAFGPCETVFASTRQIEPVRQDERWGAVAVDTEDLATAILKFRSGLLCQWTVMSGSRGKGHWHVQVWGTKGSLHDGKFTLSGQAEPVEPDLTSEAVAADVPDDSFAHSYDELIQRMQNPAAAVVGDPRRAMEAEAMVYACLESAMTGREVAVADVLSGRANAYEATVWEARERIRQMDMNRLT